jgi:hypothetical protein
MSTATVEKHRLHDLEERLKRARHALEGLLPVWQTVNQRVRSLEDELRVLEDERLKIVQGQTAFAFEDLSF